VDICDDVGGANAVNAGGNGSPRRSGAGYGVRLSIANRERYFDHAWSEVLVDIDEREAVHVPLSPSFWNECCELRGACYAPGVRVIQAS